MSTLISFVIPCYKSDPETLRVIVREIDTVVAERDGYMYEVILVCDSPDDNTFKQLETIASENQAITAINLSRNFGQHAALMAGFHYVSGDIIICLDDDGQTPALQAFRLIDMLNEGYDAVYASYDRKKHSLFRNFGTWLNDKMAQMMLGKPKDLYISSYFAVKKFIVEDMIKYENPYPYVIGMVLRATTSIANVPIDHCSRKAGESNYTLGKLFSLWINGFTSFSVKPLRISTIIGATISLVGFLFGIAIFIRQMIHPSDILGWSSMIIVQLIVGGFTLMVLGLIGEYIGRVFISINKSPQFIVREVVKNDKKVNQRSDKIPVTTDISENPR